MNDEITYQLWAKIRAVRTDNDGNHQAIDTFLGPVLLDYGNSLPVMAARLNVANTKTPVSIDDLSEMVRRMLDKLDQYDWSHVVDEEEA